jgi:hypothetical protein
VPNTNKFPSKNVYKCTKSTTRSYLLTYHMNKNKFGRIASNSLPLKWNFDTHPQDCGNASRIFICAGALLSHVSTFGGLKEEIYGLPDPELMGLKDGTKLVVPATGQVKLVLWYRCGSPKTAAIGQLTKPA